MKCNWFWTQVEKARKREIYDRLLAVQSPRRKMMVRAIVEAGPEAGFAAIAKRFGVNESCVYQHANSFAWAVDSTSKRELPTQAFEAKKRQLREGIFQEKISVELPDGRFWEVSKAEADYFVTQSGFTGVRAPRGLGAAPGDVEGFIRETADAAIVHIERAFERVGITVDGKPLGPVAPLNYFESEDDWSDPTIVDAMLDHAPRDYFAYAWFARQFQRGATGFGALDPHNAEMQEGSRLRDRYASEYSPEVRLGVDLWRLGRNVAAESRENRRRQGWGVSTLDRALEAVRVRLNWPRLGSGGDLYYDPPPPSQWPDAS